MVPAAMYLLLPLFAALAFAFGSMVFKRAYAEGAGVVHTTVVNNVLLGALFVPLAALDGRPIPWDLWYLPCLTSVAFLIGHLLSVLALKVGDVSLATPLLGAKVIFVAFFSWLLFGWPLSKGQWIAAALTTVGVLFMGVTDIKPGRRAGLTTALALACAASFALTDVSIQSWGGRFGAMNFLALMFAALALLSLATLPYFGVGSLRAPRAAWNWIFLATAMSALQSILITSSIAIWKDAAGVNVVYATRGLWSIALVWWAGHAMKNTERHTTSQRVFLLRAWGAALILAAVALAVKEAK